MKYFKTYEQWEAKPEIDYSGEYYNLRDFINDHDLQQDYIDYENSLLEVPTSKPELIINMENWDEDMEDDETYIESFLGDGYYIFFNEETDHFEIEKKKTKNSVGEVEVRLLSEAEEDDIHVILEYSGIHSEYKGRIGAFMGGSMVGGITQDSENKEEYRFDIAIDPEYQGYGISHKLLDFMIEDAKSSGHDMISAQVTNMKLLKFLGDTYNFNTYKDSDQYYATLVI